MACDGQTQVNDALITAASGPSYVQTDAGTVSQHSVTDLIKVHSYLAGTCAGTNQRRGLRINRLVPDGTVQGAFGSRFR